jgi:hypothetical protein
MNFSFSGCSWLFVYHLGVAAHLQKRFELKDSRFAGASSGSLVAVALAAGVDAHDVLDCALDLAGQAHRRWLGAVGAMSRIVGGGIEKLLPPDAHHRVEGRVFISVTELPRLRVRLVSSFTSRDDLIRAMLASCYVPVYCERPIVFRGKLWLDGGLIDNQPRLDGRTITVSPFSRGARIYPERSLPWRHAFQPPKTAVLKQYFELGARNAERFLSHPLN